MPTNQYDNTTFADGDANDQSVRVATEQNSRNALQQQAQAAHETAVPDPTVRLAQDHQDQQIRKQQNAGMSMNIW
jgi:hypothetical protein